MRGIPQEGFLVQTNNLMGIFLVASVILRLRLGSKDSLQIRRNERTGPRK